MMMRKIAGVWLCLVLGLCAPDATAQTETVAQVMAHVRAATGTVPGGDLSATQVLHGYARRSGLQEEYTLWRTPAGAFRETHAGRLAQTTGFDGHTVWQTDYSGMPRALEMQDRETTLLAAGVLTGAWLQPGGGYEVAALPSSPDATQALLSLRCKQGLLVATLAIDRSTWLPRVLTYTVPEGLQRWEFQDYRRVGGRFYPFRWTHQNDALVDSVQIVSQRTSPPAPERYAPVTELPDDTQFDPHRPAQIPLLQMRSGHLLVRPQIDGRDAGWFVLDSGAGVMVIDPVVARRLHMATFGRTSESGAGALVQASFCQGRTFTLGPLTFRRPLYEQMDLRFVGKAFGVEIAGVCGYDLFRRAVLEIDQSRRHLSLFDPRHYKLSQGQWEPLWIDTGVACVRCRFEGNRTGIFTLDTGSDGTVDFLAPAVAKMDLLAGRETTTGHSRGVGGQYQKRLGQLQWFEIGGYRFQNPTVGFSQATQGDLSSLFTVGNVGGKFLAPFTLVFDYAHQRIAFLQHQGAKNFSQTGPNCRSTIYASSGSSSGCARV